MVLEEVEEKEVKAGVEEEFSVRAEVQKVLGQEDSLLTVFALTVA